MLLTRPRLDVNASVRQLCGVFRPGDTWALTSDVFEIDGDGDFWILGPASAVVHAAHGPVYPIRHADALGDLPEVDLAMLYETPADRDSVAVFAVSPWGSKPITAADMSGALASVPPATRPDIVHLVSYVRSPIGTAPTQPASPPGPLQRLARGLTSTCQLSAAQARVHRCAPNRWKLEIMTS